MAEDLCPNATDRLACLRGLPADRLMQWGSGSGTAAPGMSLAWVPVVEGPGGVLPDTPDALMQHGEYNHGEIIVGTNKNEYGLFVLLGGGPTSVAEMRSRLQAQYGGRADDIMAIYAPSATADANQAYITLMTDVMFRCASRKFARLAVMQNSKVFLYSFEEGTAFHSDELGYVFGGGNFGLAITIPTPGLSAAIQQYWVNFAAHGDPNGNGLPMWPQFQTASDQHMTLVNPPKAGSGLQKAACDYWDDYLASTP
jgi:para-nitrobenzyl esterase